GCYASLVTDAGRTEIPAGTITVLGLMGPRRAMDTLVRHLETL
ncbi:MAG TPA: peptidyl-tRNA hydrolase, partial [Candidatus Poseidoniales archaeon]